MQRPVSIQTTKSFIPTIPKTLLLEDKLNSSAVTSTPSITQKTFHACSTFIPQQPVNQNLALVLASSNN